MKTTEESQCGWCEREIEIGEEVTQKLDSMYDPEYMEPDEAYFFICADCEPTEPKDNP